MHTNGLIANMAHLAAPRSATSDTSNYGPKLRTLSLLPPRWALRISSVVVIALASFLAFDRSAIATVIGGWDTVRAGSASLGGALAADTLTSIQANFPDVMFSETAEITDAFLSGVDVMAVWSARNFDDIITPLSTAEQTALLDFVSSGGAAVLFAEGAFDAGAPAANASIFGQFGLTATGLVSGTTGVTVTTPAAHVLTDGPFGQVSGFTTFFSAWFSDLGPLATPLATLDANGQPMLAVIPAGAITPSSGPIVLFSDLSPFTLSLFPGNEPIMLNTIAFLVPEPSAFSLAAVAFLCVVAWKGLMIRRR